MQRDGRGAAAAVAPRVPRRAIRRVWHAVALILALALGPGVTACGKGQSREMRVAKVLFDANCSRCHGRYDRGEGPRIVPGTDIRAPDLRTLSQRMGRPLPHEKVAAYIDGRDDVAAHGPREMPVWGEKLYADWPDSESREEARAGTIDLLVEYIESIQED